MDGNWIGISAVSDDIKLIRAGGDLLVLPAAANTRHGESHYNCSRTRTLRKLLAGDDNAAVRNLFFNCFSQLCAVQCSAGERLSLSRCAKVLGRVGWGSLTTIWNWKIQSFFFSLPTTGLSVHFWNVPRQLPHRHLTISPSPPQTPICVSSQSLFSN